MSTREWIVENKWECTSCHAMNRGRDMKCTVCGNAKDESEKDIIDSSAPEVTDPNMLRDARAGANWVCNYCDGQVRNTGDNCKVCRAPRERDVREAETLKRPSHNPPTPKPQPLPPRVSGYKPESFRTYNNTAIDYTGFWYGGAVAAIVVAMFCGGWALFHTKEETATVETTSWRYDASLKERVTRAGEGWGSRGDAFNVACESKYYGQEACNPHQCNPHRVSYSCNAHDCNPYTVSVPESYACGTYPPNCSTSCTSNGNGYSTCRETCTGGGTRYCTRTRSETRYRTCYDTCYRTEYDTCYDSCAVYKDYCHYNYYEWPEINRKTTSGTNGWKVYWPDLQASGSFQRLDKTESYLVMFKGEEKTWTYKPSSLAEFRYFQNGKKWLILVNSIGNVTPRNEVK